MSENHSITIPAHPNIYNGTSNRELRIDFSVPSNGSTNETGILLLVPGFGGNIDSNVYKKMREVFADRFNLVVIQCSFFGDEFMQGVENFTLPNPDYYLDKILTSQQKNEARNNPSRLMELLSQHQINLLVKANIQETEDLFNDMGFMQAIDLITSIESIKIILRENNLVFNERKVIGYGHSHGAFLLHLINRLTPHLITNIIDNSAWLEPVYLTFNRYLYQTVGKMTLNIEFDYLAKKLNHDKKALSLEIMYKDYENKTDIQVFQGTNDKLVDYHNKRKIISKVENARFNLINEEAVDHVIFNSNEHGLDADFLKMFEHAYSQLISSEKKVRNHDNWTVTLSNTHLSVDYSLGLPIFSIV